MIDKIIRKLHLSKLMFKLVRKYVHHKQLCFKTTRDALDYLHNISPDSGHTCITDRILPASDYDLEVIVPCYNAEKYIEECIDSIISQETKYNFYVTIVNDGSKDRSREILQKYVVYGNVRIIDQENRGHSGARNAGIAQVQGRYLMFVDSDDVLLPGTIEELMSLAMQNDADIVDSSHIRFADYSHKGIRALLMAGIYNSLQKPQKLTNNSNASRITGYPWGKVIKSELFNRVEFPLNYWFEDTIVWMILLPLSKRIVTSEKITTCYRMNPSSISHVAYMSNKSIDTLYVTLQLLKDREILGIELDQNQYDLLLAQFRINFNRVASLDAKIRSAVFQIQSELLNNRFPTWDTLDPNLMVIQNFLRTGDLASFELWCRWH